jgi:hypothetical protein
MAIHAPVAAVICPRCPSDSATPYFVQDHSGRLVCTVLECMVCGFLQLV